MTSPDPDRKSPTRRELLARHWPAAALALFALLALAWLIPKPSREVVTVGDHHHWRKEVAPPRREIVWQPAERVDPPADQSDAAESLIRPQLAEDGNVLYFTLRHPERGADIHRSRRVDGVWQPAEPVAELNSPGDDIGPVIRADEQRLYLYSNREGGFGGFDLYVSDREGDHWSEPRNLGPQVNSPAHEYDPAVTADGARLYFASNRTERMQRLIAAGKLRNPQDEWTTTLRADLGLNKFDLYVADRQPQENGWQFAAPLARLNEEHSNEGAPYIAPSGAFIYFVSDRPARSGEETNFDIYRARLRADSIDAPENLGPGVNTPGNEVEPALADGDFRIFFSRNDRQDDDPDYHRETYSLYASTAIEIEERLAWDASNLHSVGGLLSDWWWWLVMAALLAALLAAILWYARQITLRRASVPGFLLMALLIHVMLGLLSYMVVLNEAVYDVVKKTLDEVIVATRLESQPQHQSHTPAQQSYEKTADLRSVETVQPDSTPRQVTDTPNVPIPRDKTFMELPTRVTSTAAADRPTVVIPQIEPEPVQTPELTRRQMTPSEAIVDSAIKTEAAQPVESPADARPTPQQPVELARSTPVTPLNAPQLERRTTPTEALRPSPDSPPVELIQTEPDAPQSAESPQLARAQQSAQTSPAPMKIATETLGAPAPANEANNQPQSAAVTQARQSPATPVGSVPQMMRRPLANEPIRMAKADSPLARPTLEPAETKIAEEPSLARADSEAPTPAPAQPVATEKLAGPIAPTPAPAQPMAAKVQLARPATPLADAPLPVQRSQVTPASAPVRLAKAETVANPLAVEPITLASPSDSPAMERTAPAAPTATSDAPTVATLQLPTPAPTPTPSPAATGQTVQLARPLPETAPAPAPALTRPLDVRSTELQLAKAEISLERIAEEPIAEQTSQPAAALTKTATTAATATGATTIEAEQLQTNPAAATPLLATLTGAEVEVARQAATTPALPGSVNRLLPPRSRIAPAAAATALEPIAEIVAAPQTTATAAPLTGRQTSQASTELADATGQLETAQLLPATAEQAASLPAASAGVEIARRTDETPALAPLGKIALEEVAKLAGSPAALASESTRESSEALRPDSGSVSAALTRAASGAAATATEVTADAIELAAANPTAAQGEAAPARVAVELARAATTFEAGMAGPQRISPAQGEVGSVAISADASLARAETTDRPRGVNVQAEFARATGPTASAAMAAVATIAPLETTPAVGEARASEVAGVAVGLERNDAPIAPEEIRAPGTLSGLHDPRNPRLLLGSLERQSIDSPLTSSPLASRLLPRPASAPAVQYAEDNIGLQTLLKLRIADPETKRVLVEEFGGDDRTLAAVRLGLNWIEQHQSEDGRWSLNKFGNECKLHDGKCNGHGSVQSDAAATGFALLPFLGDGHTHRGGKHQESVKRALQWLVKNQKSNGDLFHGSGNAHMYSHGIATIALCEAYAMSEDPWLRQPAQAALDFIIKSQHQPSGGWRYQPNQAGDTSVVGWQVMALKSGQMADLNVTPKSLELSKKWLYSVAGKNKQFGQFAYQGNRLSPTMTAESLLCLEYLGAQRDDPHLNAGADYLLTQLPKKGKESSYYWYYGTQVMYHMQGEHWQQWNGALNEMLIETQRQDGPMAGTWDPKDQWENSGGRIFSSSLRLLMLEVYFRHLPLYRTLE